MNRSDHLPVVDLSGFKFSMWQEFIAFSAEIQKSQEDSDCLEALLGMHELRLAQMTGLYKNET
jgi:hypothetical protein